MRTLPAGDYHDPAVYASERAAIFGREWLCLGSAAGVVEPGSYLAETVAGWPLVVVRDLEGQLHAFHNVCAHRGGPLVDGGGGFGAGDGPGGGASGRGECRAFVCRYHGWSYELDGALRSARGSGLTPDELEGIGLFEAQATTWRGLLFVALDPSVAAIEDWLGADFVAACAESPIESWTHTTRLTHELARNWKTYTDNYLEGYHIPFVHPALARAIDTSSYRVDVHDGWVRHSADTRDGVVATGAWLYHWPNLALNIYEHGMSAERWLPTGPESCTLVLDFLFADTSAEAMARNQLDLDASQLICQEDKRICEAVQRNLAAGVYSAGRLSPDHEAGVADFQARVRAARARQSGSMGMA